MQSSDFGADNGPGHITLDFRQNTALYRVARTAQVGATSQPITLGPGDRRVLIGTIIHMHDRDLLYPYPAVETQ